MPHPRPGLAQQQPRGITVSNTDEPEQRCALANSLSTAGVGPAVGCSASKAKATGPISAVAIPARSLRLTLTARGSMHLGCLPVRLAMPGFFLRVVCEIDRVQFLAAVRAQSTRR
jgi:hypothetical protein